VPRNWFTRERDKIREEIEGRGWNHEIQSYVSTLDGEQTKCRATMLFRLF